MPRNLLCGAGRAVALLTALAILLAACGGAAEPTAAPAEPTTPEVVVEVADTPTSPPPTAPPTQAIATDTAAAPADTQVPATDTPVPENPTDTPAPTEAPAVATFGQTEDGLYFRGNPTAAVTVIDYSDFL